MQMTQRDLGNITCLDLQGRIVLDDGADLLQDRVNSLLSQGSRHLLLNMKAVTYMDTTGLATMIAVKASAQSKGGAVKLLHLPARIHDLLVITRLTTLFDTFESEAEAVQGFRQEPRSEAAAAVTN